MPEVADEEKEIDVSFYVEEACSPGFWITEEFPHRTAEEAREDIETNYKNHRPAWYSFRVLKKTLITEVVK